MALKPKLFIVEDNSVIAELLDVVCESFSTRVIAYTGKQAINILPWADCICTDGEFPSNGEFYKELIKSKKPFIIYSADEKYKGQGELAFISKPQLGQLRTALALLRDKVAVQVSFEVQLNVALLHETSRNIQVIKEAILTAQAAATKTAELINDSVKHLENIEAHLINLQGS